MSTFLVDLLKFGGIAGLGIGTALIVFRDVIRKRIFAQLTPDASFRLMRLLVGAAWSLALVAILVGYWPEVMAFQIGTNASQQNIEQRK